MANGLDPFPVLVTGRMCLRQITDADAPEVFFLRSHPGMMRYTGVAPMKKLSEAIDYIQYYEEKRRGNQAVAWGLTVVPSGPVVGIVGFRSIDWAHFRGEVGYGLHPYHQGQGIMGQVLKAMVQFGFETLGLHSIQANVDKDNLPSIRLLERNNFVREAHFKENYFFEGRFIDSVIYSILVPTPPKNTSIDGIMVSGR